MDQPVEEDFSADALLDVARADKKARGGVARCVLLDRIGAVAPAADGGYAREIPAEAGLEWLGVALRSR